ncbi:hypothetical protein SLS60_002559 [Paraconiothyrium brasiliense]|uniref:Uncharacterized protein n=1 Tax=Paraconiothyrium brasiliense TaxID=300254 RepID=A0ABR3RT80_9PLEO
MEPSQDLARTTLCDEEKFKDFSDIDSEDAPSLIQRPSRSSLFRTTVIVLSAIVVSLALVYVTVFTQKKGLKYDQCGTTADEARARGCVFEVTGFTWLPKECQDTETEDEFLQYLVDNKLDIYRDMHYNSTVPIEEVRLGNGPGLHCGEQTLNVIQNPKWREEAIQLSYTKFPYCGKPGGYNVGWDPQHGRPAEWTYA